MKVLLILKLREATLVKVLTYTGMPILVVAIVLGME
jgi:hypothetical protein